MGSGGGEEQYIIPYLYVEREDYDEEDGIGFPTFMCSNEVLLLTYFTKRWWQLGPIVFRLSLCS